MNNAAAVLLLLAMGGCKVPAVLAAAPEPAAAHPGPAASATSTEAACAATVLGEFEGQKRTPVIVRYLTDPFGAVVFEAGLAIDADGGRHAYRADDKGLDTLKNACPNDPSKTCFGILEPTLGKRVRQAYPNEAYYVSPTTLGDPSKPETDQGRYVDSETIAFLALPLRTLNKLAAAKHVAGLGLSLGDLAFVRNRENGKSAFAVFADIGPGGKIGEGSIALADALGIRSSPRRGGAADGVQVVVFPGSGNHKPRPQREIDALTKARFASWGGEARLQTCMNAGWHE